MHAETRSVLCEALFAGGLERWLVGEAASLPLAPAAGAEPHGSSSPPCADEPDDPDAPKPPPEDEPRWVLLTFADAYFSDGPISSTSSSMTVRFSPSRVSN